MALSLRFPHQNPVHTSPLPSPPLPGKLIKYLQQQTVFNASRNEKCVTFWVTFYLFVWTYGIELWGCATKSNIAVIQRYKSKLLRSMTNAPWYVSNHTLHLDLRIPYVYMVSRERTATHRTTLDSHPSSLMEPLVHLPINRRLKRKWTFDEIP